MIHSKTLHPDDYQELQDLVQLFEKTASVVPGRVDHFHRRWEYSVALSAVLRMGCQTLLEVGSGGSLFAPMATLCGLEVTCVDPDAQVAQAEVQGQKLGQPIAWRQQDYLHYTATQQYDAVVCLSTIEHVSDDHRFFDKLLGSARRLVVLTTDFSSNGQTYSTAHLRTYTAADLAALTRRAKPWRLLDGADWTGNRKPIFDRYNFASLCLCMT